MGALCHLLGPHRPGVPQEADLQLQGGHSAHPRCRAGALDSKLRNLLVPRSDLCQQGPGRIACHRTCPAFPSSCRLPAFPPDLPPHAALPQASLWSLAAVTCALSCLICFMTYSPLDYIAVRDGQKGTWPRRTERTVPHGYAGPDALRLLASSLLTLSRSACPPADQLMHVPTHPSLLRTPPCVLGTRPPWRVSPSTPEPRCCSSCWATPSSG